MYIPRHQYWTWLLGMARGRRYARAIPPQAASVHLPVFQELLNLARSLAGKPLAGFCATRSRRIQDLYGMVVHVIRCNTHYAIDNRR